MTGPRSPEARLLMALAAPRWTDARDRTVQKWLAADAALDWPHFLDQALAQQVICLVGRNLVRYGPRKRAVVPHEWVYSAAYEANVRRNRGLFTEFARILRAFGQQGIKHAVRKGPSLCALVYDDPGIRRMSDLDVLIERDSVDQAAAILADLGYAQGVPADSGDRVTPHDRKTRLFWAVHLNNALPFLKPTSEPEVRWFEVDLCLDMFQKQSAGRIDVGAVLDRARPTLICGEPSFALSPLDQLLDIGLHLYKEATSYLSIAQGRDLHLMRFIDVMESIRATAADDVARLPDFVRTVGAEREMFFALHHTDLLYPGAVPAELLRALAPPDLDYLDEYGELEQRTRRWKHGFLDRLFDSQRWTELPGPSSIPTG